MRKWISVVAVIGALAVAGCESNKMSKGDGMAMDACTHCAGTQMATADSKCPVCGMNVSSGRNK